MGAVAGLLVLLAGLSPAWGQEDACERFNARLKAFYTERSAEYGAAARRHREYEESLLAEAANARRLQADLARQARHARDPRIRRLLSAQAREAGQAAEAAEKRLHEAWLRHREDEERFKDLYKAQARALLAGRPEGCAVRGLEK